MIVNVSAYFLYCCLGYYLDGVGGREAVSAQGVVTKNIYLCGSGRIIACYYCWEVGNSVSSWGGTGAVF